MTTTPHRDLTIRLSEPQYEALCAAITLTNTTFEMDGPSSVGMKPQVPRSLHAAEDALRRAWRRAGDGF